MSEQRNMSASPERMGYSPNRLNKEQVEALLQSAPDEFRATLYIDVRSTQPHDDRTRQEFRHSLQNRFDLRLTDTVERIWQLPPVLLQCSNDEYVNLLVEARDLFTNGYFYSCVAMCGIVGEKLAKDLLRGSILVAVEGASLRPPEEAFDQFERVDVSSIIRFLNRSGLLGDVANKAAEDLVSLRNKYAHARGKNPQSDAQAAIAKLHLLLEGTVSVLKDFEIIEGRFVPRASKVSR